MSKKRIIADVYLKLMKKKSIDRITVREITDECGITRQTFYYHFHDIFDLMEWIMEEDCKTAVQDTLSAVDFHEALKRLLSQMFDKYDILRMLLNSREHQMIIRILSKIAREYISGVCKNNPRYKTLTQYEIDTALDYYSFAFAGFVIGLCERKSKDIEAASGRLAELLGDSLAI